MRTFVIGVGLTKFDKPESKPGDYPEWVRDAGTAALNDADVSYDQVEQAYAGYVYGDSTSGQRAVYELGLTGIPVVNVNNNCSTGSTTLFLARQAVAHGVGDCVLAVGFEKMKPGSLTTVYTDRTNPLGRHLDRMAQLRPPEDSPYSPAMFGNAGRDHMARYGSRPDHFAWVAWKNHKHSVDNPYAQFQSEYTLDEIADSRMIHDPLTKLQCSPTSDGAAAVVVASERFVECAHARGRAVEITGQSMTTDFLSSFSAATDCMNIVGSQMSQEAAARAYREVGIRPEDVDVCELHDCFSTNELITYEALGFAEEGKGHLLVEREATTYGGSGPVVNPSGGLIAKGHPLGATASRNAPSLRGSYVARRAGARSRERAWRSSITSASAAPLW